MGLPQLSIKSFPQLLPAAPGGTMAAFGGIQAWQRMVASGSPSPWDGAVGTIWSRDVGEGGPHPWRCGTEGCGSWARRGGLGSALGVLEAFCSLNGFMITRGSVPGVRCGLSAEPALAVSPRTEGSPLPHRLSHVPPGFAVSTGQAHPTHMG